MVIIEPDFKIVKQEGSYTLYVLKSKKEVSEDESDLYKPYGYYIILSSAIKAAYLYRKNKKYKGKESYVSLLLLYKKLKSIEEDFNNTLNSLYKPIINYHKSIDYGYSETDRQHSNPKKSKRNDNVKSS